MNTNTTFKITISKTNFIWIAGHSNIIGNEAIKNAISPSQPLFLDYIKDVLAMINNEMHILNGTNNGHLITK